MAAPGTERCHRSGMTGVIIAGEPMDLCLEKPCACYLVGAMVPVVAGLSTPLAWKVVSL